MIKCAVFFAHSMHSIRAEAMENFSDRSHFVIQVGWLGKCLKRNCVPEVKENSPRFRANAIVMATYNCTWPRKAASG